MCRHQGENVYMAEFKTDIEIARAAKKKPIQEIGAKLGIPQEHLLPYGHDKAKISADFIRSIQGNKSGKLILVTAINPTPAGEEIGRASCRERARISGHDGIMKR